MLRQHKLNGHMIFAKGAPNLMQRLPRLPPTPHVVPLLLRQLDPPPKCHKHHLYRKDFYQRVLHRPVELARLLGMWSWEPREHMDSPKSDIIARRKGGLFMR